MADPPSSPATADPNPHMPEPENPTAQPDAAPSTSTFAQEHQSSTPNPNANQTAAVPPPVTLPNQPIQPYGLPQPISVPPTAPSYRPVPIAGAPQFSPLQNYQAPGVQPPGVGVSGGVPGTVPPPMMPYSGVPGQGPNMTLRPFAPMPNGYGAVPAPAPGLPRYPAPYPAMVRPVFPPRPPGAIGVPAVSRPPLPGIPGVRPIIPPVVRPVVFPVVTPTEKPQTTVYVGKIAPTADNDFMLALLKVCGPVKSWKRTQYPSNGTLKGFGFCEFESAEAVLRALRLLSKFNIDGQELVLNVNQATREYLERYVEKKTENTKKVKESQDAEAAKEDDNGQGVEKNETSKPSEDLKKDDETENKEPHDAANFGIVTDEDRAADREALDKLTSMIEERLKANPLPPPPAQAPADNSGISNSDLPAKTRDGDSDADMARNDTAEDKVDDETAGDTKATCEHDRPDTSSPDRSRMYDRRSRDRDRERDLKREKEREIDRYEREAERERVRKERELRRKIEDAEREYERCLKDWEYREREREKERQYEKEKEKERERKPDILIEHIHLRDSLTGIHLKTIRGRGAYMINILVSDVEMKNIHLAIGASGDFGLHPDEKFDAQALPVVSGITIKNMVGSNITVAGNLSGIYESPFTSICLSNITLSVTSKASASWFCSNVMGFSEAVSPEPCSNLQSSFSNSSTCFSLLYPYTHGISL